MASNLCTVGATVDKSVPAYRQRVKACGKARVVATTTRTAAEVAEERGAQKILRQRLAQHAIR